jgi:hypothetical protein
MSTKKLTIVKPVFKTSSRNRGEKILHRRHKRGEPTEEPKEGGLTALQSRE